MESTDMALTAEAVANSDAVLRVYAAPEWEWLHEDGKQWVRAIVAETLRRAALSHKDAPDGR